MCSFLCKTSDEQEDTHETWQGKTETKVTQINQKIIIIITGGTGVNLNRYIYLYIFSVLHTRVGVCVCMGVVCVCQDVGGKETESEEGGRKGGHYYKLYCCSRLPLRVLLRSQIQEG